MTVAKGFVLEDHESHRMDEYVELWQDDSWYTPIKEAHELLKQVIPGYRPVQIKEKFGDLRFYFDKSPAATELQCQLANVIIRDAEARCHVIDSLRKRRS